MSTELYECSCCNEEKTKPEMCVCENGHHQCSDCLENFILTAYLNNESTTFSESMSQNEKCFICRSTKIVERPELYDEGLKIATVRSRILDIIGEQIGKTKREMKGKIESDSNFRIAVQDLICMKIGEFKIDGIWDIFGSPYLEHLI